MTIQARIHPTLHEYNQSNHYICFIALFSGRLVVKIIYQAIYYPDHHLFTRQAIDNFRVTSHRYDIRCLHLLLGGADMLLSLPHLN